VPVSIERRDLALDCGDMGRYANAKNILSQHVRFLLDKDEAEKNRQQHEGASRGDVVRDLARQRVYLKKTPRPFAAPSSIRGSRCSISEFALSNLVGI